MSVQLQIAYAKKLGLPAFSSHNLSVSLTTEVRELDEVAHEVERVYRLLQKAVDEQIVQPGYVPGNGTGQPRENGQQAEWKCSDKQRDLILKLVDEHNLDRQEIDDLATERFGHGIVQLNRLEMSGLLDELLERCRKKGNGRKGSKRARTVVGRAA